MKKERLDQLLTERGYFTSRPKAKAAVMAGLVAVGGRRIEKPGTRVEVDADITVAGPAVPYVSRGGLKLEKALRVFAVRAEGRTVVDIGASTGGFTDCLLQNGAAKVYAVDVGYGQLDWKLRQDERVVVMERVNARSLTAGMFDTVPSLAVIDVSFISISKLFGRVVSLLTAEGEIISLIKPQFEAGRHLVGKKGVVRDPCVHRDVVTRLGTLLQQEGAGLVGLDYSPIQGPRGNIEYLAYFCKSAAQVSVQEMANSAVSAAHFHVHGHES